ncbi:MAG: hypothetical protein V1736_07735 [Pseudomonadota bacterium]
MGTDIAGASRAGNFSECTVRSEERILSGVGREVGKMVNESRKRLSQLCTQLEPEFLDLGKQLESLCTKTCDLSKRAKEAADIETGRSITDLFLEIKSLFEQSVDVLQRNIQESQKTIEQISEIGKGLKLLMHQHRALDKLSFVTKMLGISSRIQSSRLGNLGSEFIFVSERVGKFSRMLSNYAAGFQNEIGQALDTIRKIETFLAGRLNSQEQNHIQLRERLAGVLDIVAEASSQMETLPGRIDRFSSEVSKDMGEIVAALQFQDITRQQIEHVQAALEEISSMFEGKGPDAVAPESAGTAYAKLTVQIPQLQDVREKIIHAGGEITAALSGIGERVKEQADCVMEATGYVHNSRIESAPSLLDPVMESLRNRLSESFLVSEELFKAVKNLSGLMANVGTNRARIGDVFDDMKLLAINALAQAAPLGEKGLKLAVIAGDMKSLADTWGTKAGEIISGLQDAVNMTGKLEGELMEALMRSRQEISHNQEKAAGAVIELQNADRKMKSAVQMVGSATQLLGRETARLSDSLTFDRIADSGLKHIIAGLEMLRGRIGNRLPGTENPLSDSAFLTEAMMDRYTMEAERTVHRNALGSADLETFEPGSQESSAIGPEGDFGANVELF